MTEENNTKPARVEISKKLVLINSASSLVTRMLSISVLIWLQQYLLKRITPEEYSLLPVLYSVMMFAPLITTILTAGLGRYIVEAYAKHDDERVTQIVSTMFPILCATGLIFLAGGWTFAWYIDKVLNIAPERLWDARIMMALLMFSAAITLPLSAFGAGFFVRQKFVLENLIGVATEIFRLSILFTLLFGVNTRVLWVVTASVSAGFLGQVIGVIISRRLVPTLRFRPSHIHWPIAKEITGFGGWSFVMSLANTVRMALDPIILNVCGTPTDVTCFHIGTMAFRHVQGISDTARASLDPPLTALYSKGDTIRLQTVYLRGGRIALWFSLLPALPLFIYAHEFVSLYAGTRYEQATTVMQLSLLTFPIAYGNTMFFGLCAAMARIRIPAVQVLLMNVLNLFLTILFVALLRFGAIGSALATAFAFAVTYPLFMWPTGRKLVGVSGHTWFKETIVPGLFPGAVSGLVWFLAKLVVAPQTWVSLLGCVAFGASAYIVVLLAACFGLEDKKDLRKMICHLPGGKQLLSSKTLAPFTAWILEDKTTREKKEADDQQC